MVATTSSQLADEANNTAASEGDSSEQQHQQMAEVNSAFLKLMALEEDGNLMHHLQQ